MQRLVIFIAITFLLPSCEMVVDIDMPEHTPVIVANCLFNPDTTFSVHISNSVGITSDQQTKIIENASVELFEGGSLIGNLVYGSMGFYTNPAIKAVAGKPYEIRVTAAGYTSISAADTIPKPLQILVVQVKDSVTEMMNDMQQYFTEVTIAIPDPASESNYYGIEVFVQDSMFSYNNKLSLTSNDPAAEQANDMEMSLKFSDALFNGKTYNFSFRYQDYYMLPGDTVFLSFYSLSRAYYFYTKTKALFDMTGFNPFAEPVQVYTNVNGGLGIFAGRSVYTIKIKY